MSSLRNLSLKWEKGTTVTMSKRPSRIIIITSRISGVGYKNGAICVCVCLFVCQFLNTLTAEPTDVQSQNLVQGLILMTS